MEIVVWEKRKEIEKKFEIEHVFNKKETSTKEI